MSHDLDDDFPSLWEAMALLGLYHLLEKRVIHMALGAMIAFFFGIWLEPLAWFYGLLYALSSAQVFEILEVHWAFETITMATVLIASTPVLAMTRPARQMHYIAMFPGLLPLEHWEKRLVRGETSQGVYEIFVHEAPGWIRDWIAFSLLVWGFPYIVWGVATGFILNFIKAKEGVEILISLALLAATMVAVMMFLSGGWWFVVGSAAVAAIEHYLNLMSPYGVRLDRQGDLEEQLSLLRLRAAE